MHRQREIVCEKGITDPVEQSSASLALLFNIVKLLVALRHAWFAV